MAECPFSWTSQEEKSGCLNLSSKKVWKPVECRKSKCQLWDGDDCVIKNVGRKLDRLEKELKEG